MLFIVYSVSLFAKEREHTIQRGETIETIAKMYNVIPQSIYDLNPGLKDMFFVGIVIKIPESNMKFNTNNIAVEGYKTVYRTNPQDENSNTGKDLANNENQTNQEMSPTAFNAIYLSYYGQFKYFDSGFYGIGMRSFGDNGFFYTFSLHGSYGITDPGVFEFRTGAGYGCVLHPMVLVSGAARMLIDVAKVNRDWNAGVGVVFTPGLNLKISKLILGVSVDLGWMQNYKRLYSCAEISLGIRF